MNLLRGMKLYTVHIPSGAPDAQERAIFLREGFNWSAFFFGAFWALYHRLWLQACVILLVNSFLMILARQQVVSFDTVALMQLGFQILIGYHANDWRRAKLSLSGYILADVTAADSLLRAEQRYFERVLHPAH
jgi:hypothetical protein